jgi:hypothetical protein
MNDLLETHVFVQELADHEQFAMSSDGLEKELDLFIAGRRIPYEHVFIQQSFSPEIERPVLHALYLH